MRSHYEAEKMVFPLNVMFQIYKTAKKSGGRFIEILVNLDVVLRFLTFLCLILVLFCSVLRFWIPFEPKTKAFCRILKKLKVICLTWTGLCPKVKKEKKNIIKTGYHAFVYLGIQTVRNKLGKQINCPRSLKSKFLLSVQEDY